MVRDKVFEENAKCLIRDVHENFWIQQSLLAVVYQCKHGVGHEIDIQASDPEVERPI